MAAKSRLNQGPRDMVLSLVALLLIIGALMFANRGCAFSPGTPTADPSTAPSVDAADSLQRAAAVVDFPVRVPAVPAPWRANSSSTGRVEPVSVVVRAGWLTPGRFVQLSQSAASVPELVAAETGASSGSSGVVDVDGTQWTVYPGRRSELAWATSVSGATVLITGTGDEEEFRALARAYLAAAPVKR
ncbi:DUF4245 domain-containing protein [Actinokineospora sp. NBRC 105648]|uniref:DUF4245 domain-containing protein n=1 Tax=Actinokineospora sp. NBRC 105648 TaxID=3032206 RepID=UPI0024A2AF08|nr:DUF4245 domain-containing protein [Actinokineospora sp. NBRC 105648]GLZ41220.1 hypothetical protein Acsp05_48440 [Actinokineospora sp. NBRC 105648]